MDRILTALALLLLVWAVTEWTPVWAFLIVAALAISAALWESYRLLETGGARPFKLVGLATTLAVAWSCSGYEPTLNVALPLAVAAVVTPILALGLRPDPASMVNDSVRTLFPVLFVGLTLSYVIGLRAVPGEDGKDLVYLLLVCVTLEDTAAFYAGRLMGRRKMAPMLSPNKSWEGAVAGVVACVGGALLSKYWFYGRLPLGHAISIGLVLGIACMLGDLAESALKRAAGAKDSSRLLPGHGGVLDRTDSLLFSAPILYYYYSVFIRGAS